MASFNINNAPIDFDMDTFQAVSDDLGSLARSCRYAVTITPPVGLYTSGTSNGGTVNDYLDVNSISRDLTYLCEAAEFPGRGFENIEIAWYGPKFKVPHRSQYEPINLTFICRYGSLEREFFDEWMNLINPVDTYNFNYRDSYATNLRLFSFDEDNNPTYSFTLVDCFPILINPQPVTWTDDNFLRLVVNFTYTKWLREGRDGNSYYTNSDTLSII